jgi:cbb3-type cytochrome oxidase maturation protein
VDIVYLMVPLGLLLVALGLWAFFWAVGSGQFDDLDSPGWSVLKDDEKPAATSSNDGAGDTPQPGDANGHPQSSKSGEARKP